MYNVLFMFFLIDKGIKQEHSDVHKALLKALRDLHITPNYAKRESPL